jgi:hypothetical protein
MAHRSHTYPRDPLHVLRGVAEKGLQAAHSQLHDDAHVVVRRVRADAKHAHDVCVLWNGLQQPSLHRDRSGVATPHSLLLHCHRSIAAPVGTIHLSVAPLVHQHDLRQLSEWNDDKATARPATTPREGRECTHEYGDSCDDDD